LAPVLRRHHFRDCASLRQAQVSLGVPGGEDRRIAESFDLSEATTMTERIVHVSDDTFETEVLNAEQPVLVDYWAEWCGPCKAIGPILGEIAEEYADKLKVVKLNIDNNPATPPKYNIRGIPTLMLFRNGNVEAIKVGALSKSQLAAFIDSNL
jgi:thioredoxin 1